MLEKKLKTTWISYLVAIAAVLLMSSLRALMPLLGEAMALMPLVVAVFIAAWYGGLKPGILATVLCALAAVFFFTEPARVFWMIDAVDQIQVLTFILVGVLISYLCEQLHNAQRTAGTRQRQLQQEIEERQKIEHDALRSQALLQAIIENASTAIFVKDLEGRYLLGNRSMCELFDVSKDELIGLNNYDILPKDVADKLRANDREVIEKNRTMQHEEMIIVHGEPQHYVSVKFPLHDASGKVYASGGIATNITDLKKAQQALQESETRLKVALTAADMMVWETDLETRYTIASEAARRLWGFQNAPAEGYMQAIHPDDLPRVIRKWSNAVEHGEEYKVEYRVRHAEGEKWFLSQGQMMAGTDGKPQKMIGVTADVTWRRRTETLLRKRNERLRLLWETAGILLARRDAQAMFSAVFAKVEAHLNLDTFLYFTIDEAGATLQLEYSRGLPEAVRHAMTRLPLQHSLCGHAIQQQQPVVITQVQQSNTGEAQAARELGLRACACYPLLTGDHAIGTLFFATHDRDELEKDELEFLQTLSQSVTLALEYQRLVSQLRESDRRKDEFLATLAHELRNPLAPIRNALSLLRQTDDEQLSGQALAIMERQLRQMVRLIDDLLDLSRITRSRLELRRQRIELSEIINNAVETVQPMLTQAAHRFTLTLPAGQLWLDADPVRLAQVFSNLLHNASKYTPAGGDIRLSAEQAGDEAVICISDSGIGIPADKLAGVFDMFMLVDRSLEQSHGGLGIGLTLVRYLVDMHQGRVTATSAGAGKGSEFSVYLPLAEVSPEPAAARDGAAADQTAAPASRRIVVADDNEDAADSLSMILRLFGHEVRTAYDGQAAVAAVTDFQPDVVFLDIGMPRLNGYAAAQQIRNQPHGGEITLIALTGWGQQEDREMAKKAGFDHHLVKPVEAAVVKALLADLASVAVGTR